MVKVLVTGANGMLGQDLCPMLEDCDFVDEVIETDRHNLDITNEIEVNKVLNEYKPDYIIHCAAYTNVDKAETDLENAEKINVKGTENIAKAANKIDATLIYISTDYVFDGTKKSKYLPIDAPNPLNNYGLTKLHGEQAVQKYCKKYYITRTSWLYGHHGKNFIETMLKYGMEGKELKVVNDQFGCPTWTVGLSEGICDIIEENPDYGIYHICGSKETSWYEFAKEIFKQAGVDAKLFPCTTEEYPVPAKRPKYSVMENDGICEDWKVSLKKYLELRIN
ncbi:dTDP-4-dehydrorhamnose reductase [bacterium]|nr:dTDP-4-dehydrorhamnose reductase [bacterium]